MTEQEFTARVLAAEPRLYRVATAILGASPDRDDAWQEALLRAWRKIPGLRDEQKFEPWLTRILINECRDVLRRRRRAPLPVSDVPDASEPVKDEALRDALFSLEPGLRLTLTLKYLEGYSVREIARILKTSEYSIKGKLQRGREKLRAALSEQEV